MRPGKDATKPELVLQIVAFFAVNPDEELTTDDAMHKWGPIHRTTVWAAFRRLQGYGYISADVKTKNLVRTNTYRAGPKLLRTI